VKIVPGFGAEHLYQKTTIISHCGMQAYCSVGTRLGGQEGQEFAQIFREELAVGHTEGLENSVQQMLVDTLSQKMLDDVLQKN
jgi:hypothetical protein